MYTTTQSHITRLQADDYAAMPSLDPADGVAGDDAYPLYAHRDTPASRTVRLRSLYAATRSLDDVTASLSIAVGEVGPRLLASGEWDGEASVEVLVNMPCTYFALDASRCGLLNSTLQLGGVLIEFCVVHRWLE